MSTDDKVENRIGEHLQPWPVALVHVVALGSVDAVAIAQREMQSRGMGVSGSWVGFVAAEKDWNAYRQRQAQAEPDAKVLEDIARRHCGVDTLTVRGGDRLDFHDVGVVGLRDALAEAFKAGRSGS